MEFELNEEQVQLKSGLDRYLASANDFTRRTAAIRSAAGRCEDLWQALAGELGVLGAGLPEAHGGFGGALEQMVVMEAAGRALLGEPLAETLCQAAPLLAHAGGAVADALLAGIVAGQVRIAHAVGEADMGNDLAGIDLPATRTASGWRLDGEKQVVVGAPWATHLLLAARTAGVPGNGQGISLFVVPARTKGLTMHPYRTLDERQAADLVLSGVELGSDALIGMEGAGLALLEEWRDRAIAAATAEACGLLERLIEDTVAYAKQREQFGQKIGSFQALQHRMVDMYLQLELVRSAALLVCQALDGPAEDRAKAASSAKVTVAQACRFIGQNAVQLHGGMGMTDELPIGHYFKRATVIEHSFGSAGWHTMRRAAMDAVAA
jgi:alkylation response protein AidB-like acyl-CoA dehydrogenase